MMYSKTEIGTMLKLELDKGYNIKSISKWAVNLLQHFRDEESKEIADVLINLFMMDAGPKFEYNQEELSFLSNMLVNDVIHPIKKLKEIKNTKFELSVGGDIDFKDLVADIGFENNLVALLTQEEGFENLRIRIYPPKDGEFWDFRFDQFQEIINRAKQRLGEFRKPSENIVVVNFHDLPIINNSLNEVCNGLHVDDFEKKIGVTKSHAQQLLKKVHRNIAKQELHKKDVEHFHLTVEDLIVVKNALTEVLRQIDDWEFETRMDVTPDEAKQFIEKIAKIILKTLLRPEGSEASARLLPTSFQEPPWS